MINFRKLFLAVIPTVTLFISSYAATGVPTSDERREITDVLCRILRREVLGGGCKIERMRANGDRLEIYASAGLSYYPFREDNVQAMYDSIRAVLPSEYGRYKIVLYTDRHNIEQLILRDFDIPMKMRKGSWVALMNKLPQPLRPRPVFTHKQCNGCAVCMRSCPVGAISMDKKQRPNVDVQKCIRCFCCQELCPKNDIIVRRNPLFNLLK